MTITSLPRPSLYEIFLGLIAILAVSCAVNLATFPAIGSLIYISDFSVFTALSQLYSLRYCTAFKVLISVACYNVGKGERCISG